MRCEGGVQHGPDLAGDAAADPAAVDEAVRGRLAHEQRAEPVWEPVSGRQPPTTYELRRRCANFSQFRVRAPNS